MHKTLFSTKLTDHPTTDADELGSKRIEHDPILGTREYQWVRNKSGGALNADSLVGWEVRSEAAITATVNTDTSKIVDSGHTWTPGELVGFYVRVLDDAGAAGAAPEGQTRRITANDATSLTVDTAFTAAVTTGDTFEIHRPHHIIASADAMVAQEVAGVLMATLADGEYGWVCRKGLYPTADVIAAGTTLASGAALKAGTSLMLVAGDAADNGEVIAANIFQVTTDTVSRKALVKMGLP